MGPSLAMDDASYCHWVNFELVGKIDLHLPIRMSGADIQNVGLSKLSEAVFGAAPVDRDFQYVVPMLEVLAGRTDFQIDEAVVVLDAIQVIDLVAARDFSEECPCDKAMYALRCASGPNATVNKQIAFSIRTCGHDVFGIPPEVLGRTETSYPAEVRCLVIRQPRNVAPRFH